MTLDWRLLLLGRIDDHARELPMNPTADQIEDWTTGLAIVVADVIEMQRASEVDTDEPGYGHGV